VAEAVEMSAWSHDAKEQLSSRAEAVRAALDVVDSIVGDTVDGYWVNDAPENKRIDVYILKTGVLHHVFGPHDSVLDAVGGDAITTTESSYVATRVAAEARFTATVKRREARGARSGGSGDYMEVQTCR
jgi:hypothetical protein